MRSQQVYLALAHVPNRFALCRITCMALRKLHRTQARPEDTISDVLTDIDRYRARRVHTVKPENVPATIDLVPSLAIPEGTHLEAPAEEPHVPDLAFVEN